MGDMYEQWVDTLACVGIKPLSDDTCCRLLAIIYVFAGDKEAFSYNRKLRTDMEYAKKRMNIGGSLVPDVEMAALFRIYAEELEAQRCICLPCKPQWAVDLMEKYGIKL